MSNNNNANKESIITRLLVPVTIALVAGGTSPWWFNALQANNVQNDLPGRTSPLGSTVPNTPPAEEHNSTLPEFSKSIPKSSAQKELDAPIEKFNIFSAEINNENEYSSNHDTTKIFDSNVETYWRSKRGAILDVFLEFSFSEPKNVSRIRMYLPTKGSSYAQPKIVTLIFFNDSGEIASKQIHLQSSSDKWQQYDFEPIYDVSKVKLEINELTKEITRYLSINELEFYGY